MKASVSCLPKINAFISALNDHGITGAIEVRNRISMVVGSSLAANHVGRTNSFIITPEDKERISYHCYEINAVFGINYDLALARAVELVNLSYNQLTGKGYTDCTAPTIPLGDSEVCLFGISEAHGLFKELNNFFSFRDKEYK